MLTRRPTAGDDGGFALVLVVGFAAVLAGLVAIGASTGVRTLQSSRAHVDFEGAIAVAETGVDDWLAKISQAYNSTPSMPPPAHPKGSQCEITTAPASFATGDAERVWFRNAFNALPNSCLDTVPGGQYIAVRPSNKQAVYSMSWVPSRAAEKNRRRLIKAEYLFAPYKPSNAVLTQGSLDFSGSVAIQTLTSTPSDVHSNNNVSGYNGSTNIQGALSASGTTSGSCPSGITGGCTASAPVQSIPNISARAYYSRAAQYPGTWFDLCPDGVMRAPGATPCTGTPYTGSTNGWIFTAGSGTTAPSWLLPKAASPVPNGVYYVYRGDAQVGGNGNSSDTQQVSVLAEAAPTGGTAASCNKLGGNVRWRLFNMTPWLQGLQLLADANLTGDANASAGSGLFLAGHKVDLQTSSSTLTGAVVAGGTCPAAGPNTIQGVTIKYDDTLESPLSDIIRTSLWLDYAAG